MQRPGLGSEVERVSLQNNEKNRFFFRQSRHSAPPKDDRTSIAQDDKNVKHLQKVFIFNRIIIQINFKHALKINQKK